MVSTGGFVTSLLTSFVVFLILVALFTVLSRMPANYNIYYPARILNGQGVPGGPGKKKPGPFAWIREAYMASEDDILAIAGLDATVYIRFFTTVLEILGFSALICLPLLIPLAVTSHNNAEQLAASSNNTYSSIDNLSMSNLPVCACNSSLHQSPLLVSPTITDSFRESACTCPSISGKQLGQPPVGLV
jgi:hypothetical protein